MDVVRRPRLCQCRRAGGCLCGPRRRGAGGRGERGEGGKRGGPRTRRCRALGLPRPRSLCLRWCGFESCFAAGRACSRKNCDSGAGVFRKKRAAASEGWLPGSPRARGRRPGGAGRLVVREGREALLGTVGLHGCVWTGGVIPTASLLARGGPLGMRGRLQKRRPHGVKQTVAAFSYPATWFSRPLTTHRLPFPSDHEVDKEARFAGRGPVDQDLGPWQTT